MLPSGLKSLCREAFVSELSKRVITSAVLAAAFLWSVFTLSSTVLFYLLCFVLSIAIYELWDIFEWSYAYIASSTLAMLGTLLLLLHQPYLLELFVPLLFFFTMLFFTCRCDRNLLQPVQWLLIPAYATCLIIAGFALVECYLAGVGILMALVALTVSSDIGGYLAGRLFGKHPLCPAISPGKTIQGVIGSYLMAAIVVFIGLPHFRVTLVTGLTIAFVVVTLTIMGDLVQSWLKRLANVKDTGVLLPGHGGVLDRIDGLVFSAPAFFLFLNTL